MELSEVDTLLDRFAKLLVSHNKIYNPLSVYVYIKVSKCV